MRTDSYPRTPTPNQVLPPPRTPTPNQVLPPPVAGAVRLETRLVAAVPPMDETELALRFRAEVSSNSLTK